MKRAPLLKRSITTNIIDFSDDGGRCVIKSIVSSSHTDIGVGRGCGRPEDLELMGLDT